MPYFIREWLPNQLRSCGNPIDTPNLTFEPVDELTFQHRTGARGGAGQRDHGCAGMNAANEEAANFSG